MGLLDAADGIADLFAGERTTKARRASLLVASVFLANRPKMLDIVVDEEGA
ncbi:MAG TPA: hypothetical protein VLT47_10895 [Anaeromyxobacteraceae bacterium]|nr:hypothetical protein [Anaeromyxobacteraceae bacterium]